MNEGDVILASVPQADGSTKHRPAIILREMPRFGDLLVCGVSTQLHQRVSGFDELITPNDADFSSSGLLAPSLIRLGFLAVIPHRDVSGAIGSISSGRHVRLLGRLSEYLIESVTHDGEPET
jgi:mRNA interferase MazF